MAVLGLVVERPNQTVVYYANELTERFPHARFAKGTAYTALRQMARGKRPRVRRTRQAPGFERTFDLYAPAPDGVDTFRAWMCRPPIALPAVRHLIYGRVELARLEDLPQLIRIVREEEDIATDLYAAASGALRQHQIKKGTHHDRPKTRADFERELRETWLYVGPLHWSSRATLCTVVLERLEEIAEEAGIAIPERKSGAERDEELRERRAT
jgi:hypothetical protein